MKRLGVYLICVGQFLAFSARADTALIAVATNFSDAAKVLQEQFSKQSEHQIEFVFGSTGKLFAQIQNGAPFDGFLAADQARPDLLYQSGKGDAPFTYAEGILVWWPGSKPEQMSGKIAIANPALAPYGYAAKEVLASMPNWDFVKDQIVMGENVGQAFSIVATGNASVGLVALASVIAYASEENWQLAEGHSPILQDGILLQKGFGNEAARSFFEFLTSSTAQTAIANIGFKPVRHE